MTFNTGNPIGSTDARDLSDNAENFDKALNSTAETWNDRLGVTRDTFEGALSKLSFYRVGTFTTGYTLTNMRQTLEYGGHEYSWSGAFPKVVAAGATPATSGGIGDGAWVDRTDVTLRGELGESAEIIGFNQGVDVGGSSNKVNIDILIKRESVNLLRGIPFSEWDAVKDGTSTLDISAIMQNAVNYCASNNAKLDLPHGKLNFSNVLLPSSGIDIGGVSTHQTNIFNTSLTTPVFYTATGRNLWINLHGFTIVGKNLATSADVSIQDFEHLSLNDINVTTSGGERTGESGILLSRSSSSAHGYYLCTEQLKVDKHLYGLKLLGVSGANLNSNGVRGAVTNDNTNAGIRADFCSGLRLKDGSAELCRNNIEIFDSTGVVVSGYYMERPAFHNVKLIRADMSQIINNPVLSSAGSGPDGSGSSPNASGRGVFVDQSNSVRIDGNNFISPWSFYDVELTSTCQASQVTNNGKKDRVKGFNIFTVEVLDSAANSIIRNMQKTAGGAVRMYDNSTAKLVLGGTTTQEGKELSISNSTAAIYTGTAFPDGAVTAGPGSIYLRRANDAGIAVIYSKRSGTGNTGWVAVG